MKTFGASAPLQQLQQKFGFTAERVAAAARQAHGGSRKVVPPTDRAADGGVIVMELVDVQTSNPLRALNVLGQSIWLDSISRHLLASGELKQLIANDGLRGVTSNPAIFEHAIRGSADYAAILEALESRGDQDAKRSTNSWRSRMCGTPRYAMRPVYDSDSEARWLRQPRGLPVPRAQDSRRDRARGEAALGAVDRPNLMIKVPAQPKGYRHPATHRRRINVNVTLLFAIDAYEAVSDAYLSGLETFLRTGAGRDRIGSIASVASFFVSRIDTLIDDLLRRRLENPRNRSVSATRPGSTAGNRCSRQRQARLPVLPANARQPALEGFGRKGRADAAPAVGQHGDEGSVVPGRDVRR